MFKVFTRVRLQTETTVRPHLRSRRPLSFSGFSVGFGQEIRHGCHFLRSLIRALGHLPGGLSRFIPCHDGAHHARLLHFGWGQYGHGLTSRPRGSCDHRFLTPFLNFFGYPDGAVAELFNGTSKLRCSSTPSSKNSLHGQFLLPQFVYWWLALVLDSVFIFQTVILMESVQRSASASQVNVPLSGVNGVLGKVFQRPNDGKGQYLKMENKDQVFLRKTVDVFVGGRTQHIPQREENKATLSADVVLPRTTSRIGLRDSEILRISGKYSFRVQARSRCPG